VSSEAGLSVSAHTQSGEISMCLGGPSVF